MGLFLWLHMFLIFILQLQFAYYYYYPTRALSYSPPPHNHSLCPYEQSLVLLQFKQNFNISRSASEYCDFFGQSSRPKTKSWNRTIDCCKWEGVTCDGFTGHVIGLDLSCSQLQGILHSNNTFFKLSHLKSLNLAFNDFSLSRISHQFGQFASLTHLNLSESNFAGDVPSEIPHLSNLVSLDLSYLSHVKLEKNNFQMLLHNSTQLRQLSLSSINIFSAILPVNLSSSLTLLDLSNTGLHGNLPGEVLHLPNLQKLRLSGNRDLTVYFPKAANVRSSSPLRWLDLSDCNVFGNLPEWLRNLTQVNYLMLSSINFSLGLILDSVLKLQHLSHLYLFSNNFNTTIPSSVGNLTQLRRLYLSYNSLTGPIPSSIGNLTQLESLYLSSNSLTGPIMSSIGKLTQLKSLDLSSNSLIGPIPSSIGKLTQLERLYLSFNSLIGPIPLSIGNLTQLKSLDLSSSSLTGPIPLSIGNLTQLKGLYLSFNSLSGPIPSLIGNLTQLESLYLSSNSLTGPIPSSFGNLTQLELLYLSFNYLTGPIMSSIIGNLTQLRRLVLSFNSLTGPIPSSIGKLTQLKYLDLSSNLLTCPIPHSITKLRALQDLRLSRNSLIGIMELSMFSNLPSLTTLELSNNNLSVRTTNIDINATFPNLKLLRLSSCKVKEFQDLLMSIKYINVLDLRQNILQGPLPSIVCDLTLLEILDLSHNNLSGAILQCLGRFNGSLSFLNLEAN